MKKLWRLMVLCLCLAALTACTSGSGSKNKNQIINGNSITPMPPSKQTEANKSEDILTGPQSMTAVLVGRDAAKMQLIVKDIYSGESFILSYNGGTDVKNVFDEIVTATQLKIGEILDVTYDAERKKAFTVYGNKEAFKTVNVEGFKATQGTHTITFGSASYMYTDTLTVISGNQVIDASQVMNRDVVTVRGIENKIYSVTIDKGHGYLTFKGADAFIGGMVELGTSYLYTVSEDMMIVVPEGEYEVVMSNKKHEAKKTVYVAKDSTVTLDFSDSKEPANKKGTVEFQILPKDAELFIEGNKTDYKEPVKLEYGNYTINILSNDYATYTTKIKVASTYQVEKFDLAKIYSDGTSDSSSAGSTTTAATTQETTTVATNVTTTTPTTTAPTTTAQSTTNPTAALGEPATTTGAVAVNIAKPAGASVYVDNVYVGTAPVTINKDAGEYVITFKQAGYITKSYVVDVESTDGTQTLNFPAMSEE